MAARGSVSRRGLLAGGIGLLALACKGPGLSSTRGAPAAVPTETESAPEVVTIVVPYAVGGPRDALMRLVAEHLARALDRPVQIQNVTGAGGAIGARQVLGARPDGFTLLAAQESLLSGYHMGATTFNWTDFEPVALLFSTPDLIVARADGPWRDVHDLVKDAKRRPEQISWGATFGSTPHLLASAISHRTGARFKLVGYDATAERIDAVVAGQVDVASYTSGVAVDDAKWAKLRPLGAAGLERDPAFPDVLTLREQEIDVTFVTNRGLFAPKGTPEATLAWLESGVERALAEPELVSRAQDEMHARVHFLGRERYVAQLRQWDRSIQEIVAAMGLRTS